MGPDVESERTTNPDSAASALSAGLERGRKLSENMTENRITELWNKAVAEIGDCTYPQIITRFAEFVALYEREACAKVCDLLASENRCNADCTLYSENYAHECDRCAAAIRMRSNAKLTGVPPTDATKGG